MNRRGYDAAEHARSGAGKLFAVIVVIAVSLAVTIGPALTKGTPGKGGKGEASLTLAGIAGGLQPPLAKLSKQLQKTLKKQLGQLLQPKGKGKGKVGPVPKGLTFTNGAGCRPKGDWRKVDPRVRTVLTKAAKRYKIRVSCLRTGHSTYVKGTRRVSNHVAEGRGGTRGRAVDIDRVNGRPVRASNAAARRLALAFGRGQMGAQPSEVGSPWFSAGVFFTDAGHQGHLHVGFGGR